MDNSQSETAVDIMMDKIFQKKVVLNNPQMKCQWYKKIPQLSCWIHDLIYMCTLFESFSFACFIEQQNWLGIHTCSFSSPYFEHIFLQDLASVPTTKGRDQIRE